MKNADAIFQFLKNGIINSEEGFFYCKNRSESSARLTKWMADFKAFGLTADNSAILTAIIGELTNNSFDHNLGQWHEPAGCAVGIFKKKHHVDILIADRGQGIVSSLGNSLKENFTAENILKKAFEERISGRAPERRGNGLKFVLSHVQKNKGSLQCYSQNSIYSSGNPSNLINTSELPKDFGTLIYIEWSLK